MYIYIYICIQREVCVSDFDQIASDIVRSMKADLGNTTRIIFLTECVIFVWICGSEHSCFPKYHSRVYSYISKSCRVKSSHHRQS